MSRFVVVKGISNKPLSLRQNQCQVRHISLNPFKKGGGEGDKEPPEDDIIVQPTTKPSLWKDLTPEEIMRIRNKSRLPRDIVCELKGIPVHGTRFDKIWQYNRSFVRKYFAQFGVASGLKPGVCWPSKSELEFRKKFEETFTIPFQKALEEKRKARKEAEKSEAAYRAEIVKNLKKLPQAKKEFWAKVREKEKIAEEEKTKRERLVQEVREYLGYDVAVGDIRFQEAVEKMEAAKVVEQKSARKQEKQAKLMAQLTALVEEQIKTTTGEDDQSKAKPPESASSTSPENEVKKEGKKKATKKSKEPEPLATDSQPKDE